MSDVVDWEARNNEYLAARLAWLRARLGMGLRREAPEPVVAGVGGRRPVEPDRRVDGGAEEAAARAVLDRFETGPHTPALVMLKDRFGLSRFEGDLLWLAVAMELDTSVAGLCALACGDPGRPYPTFALAFSIFDNPAWEALSPERPLRHWRLIDIHQPGAQPLTTSALRADERVVNYVKGLNYLDDRLAGLTVPIGEPDGGPWLSPSQDALAARLARALRRAAEGGRLPIVQLQGSDNSGKQALAKRVAGELGLHLYRVAADLLPTGVADLDLLARLWQRESALLPLALYVDAFETERPEHASSPAARLLNRLSGLAFVDTREGRLVVDRPLVIEDVVKPTGAEQEAAWQTVLDGRAGDNPARLASQFDLGVAAIGRIAESAASEVGPVDPAALAEALWRACLMHTRPRLDALAHRIECRASWSDLVLADPELAMLRQIAAQVHGRRRVYDEWGFRARLTRGLGITALFAGESGTGKTFAAEVLAHELGLNLYRIDLSAVVSKYIGETEKNLRRLFDAAEDGGAILFFDEADALFGKRSEVKDSHDRYANIEVNYLLQRMEAYRGLAILATNMKSALDPAFLRRLRFIVSFPFPGPAERRRIWQKACPAETPLDGIDFERLARLTLTGGAIHNIVLNAAFSAAHDGTPVGMTHMLGAARAEFVKMDRPLSEADFAWRDRAAES